MPGSHLLLGAPVEAAAAAGEGCRRAPSCRRHHEGRGRVGEGPAGLGGDGRWEAGANGLVVWFPGGGAQRLCAFNSALGTLLPLLLGEGKERSAWSRVPWLAWPRRPLSPPLARRLEVFFPRLWGAARPAKSGCRRPPGSGGEESEALEDAPQALRGKGCRVLLYFFSLHSPYIHIIFWVSIAGS